MAKMKKVTVADMIDSVEIRVLPLSIQNQQISRIYKLRMKLKEHELVSVKDCQETLKVMFLRELEDAIENHIILLSRISGIKDFTENSQSKIVNERGEDASDSRSQEGNNGDDDDNGDDEWAEDLGSDVQKRKQQAADEIDYEDGSEDELNEVEPSSDLASETDQADDGIESMNGEIEDVNVEDGASKMAYEHVAISKPTSSDREAKSKTKKKKKVKATLVKKDFDRAFFVETKGLQLEVHFRFTNEPHILLAQVLLNSNFWTISFLIKYASYINLANEYFSAIISIIIILLLRLAC